MSVYVGFENVLGTSLLVLGSGLSSTSFSSEQLNSSHQHYNGNTQLRCFQNDMGLPFSIHIYFASITTTENGGSVIFKLPFFTLNSLYDLRSIFFGFSKVL